MTGKLSTVVTFPQTVKQELPYRCSACGADRGCDCNAPAIEKIAKARAADPDGSTRAIARAAGVSQSSAQRAMKSTEPNGSVRVGLDGKTRRMPDRRSTENDEADDPSPENMASPAGLRNLIKWVNDTTSSVGRWHKNKIIKSLASRRFDDEEWDELRKTLKLLRRRVNAALSAIDVARPAVVDDTKDPETKKEKEEALRKLIYETLRGSGLPTILYRAPRYLSNQFYLEIIEDFLSKRKIFR